MLQALKKTNTHSPQELLEKFFAQANTVILGKSQQIRLSLCALLADGHILIEDVPGVGKTTLVKYLAHALGLVPKRIQFTNDLLPADILGVSVFDAQEKIFKFHPGPIFANVVIADELNRATPKTQSACLQAMEEKKVSVDGQTHTLPNPFFVIATQNPREQTGTYPLPESQLDRFMMRIELGFPDRQAEAQLLLGENRSQQIEKLESILDTDVLLALQKQVEQQTVSPAIIEYIQDILDYSRTQIKDYYGLSPRTGLALLKAAKAWSMLEGRKMVLPEDVKAVGVSVMAHRLNPEGHLNFYSGVQIAQEILNNVAVDLSS